MNRIKLSSALIIDLDCILFANFIGSRPATDGHGGMMSESVELITIAGKEFTLRGSDAKQVWELLEGQCLRAS